MIKKIFYTIFIMFLMIMCKSVKAYDSFEIGDEIEFNDENWYVIKDSNEDTDYVTIISKKSLTVEEVNAYGNGLVSSSDGTVPFYDCELINQISNYYPGDDCNNDYAGSLVKKIVDAWATDRFLDGDLVDDENGYKARLLNLDDLTNDLGFTYVDNMFYGFYTPSEGSKAKFLYKSSKNLRLPFWLSTPSDDIKRVYMMESGGMATTGYVISSDHNAFIRPVVNLKKDALSRYNSTDDGDKSSNNQENGRVCRIETRTVPIFPKYKVGDVVTYNEQQYLVIENSSEKKEYVSLLKIDPLTSTEIGKYYAGPTSADDSIGVVQYSFVDGYWYYSNSNVKTIIDAWVEDKGLIEGLLSNNQGYDNAAYIYPNDYDIADSLSSFGYTTFNGPRTVCEYGGFCYTVPGDPYNPTLPTPYWFDDFVARFIHSDSTPTWLYDSGYDYWIYSGSDATRKSHYAMGRNGDVGMFGDSRNIEGDITSTSVVNVAAVRPTIEVFKPIAFGMNKAYQRGDIVNYKGIDFYVLEDSAADNGAVILLKKTPLTQGEINKYLNLPSPVHDDNAIQYKSGCSYYGECSLKYEDSDVKKVVDAWAQDNLDLEKLVDVNGYKVRLITIDDLIENLGYDSQTINTYLFLEKTDDTPVEVYQSHEMFWTMNVYGDYGDVVYSYNEQAYSSDISNYYKVRPVINLYKCELGGCQYTEVDVEVCDPETNDLTKAIIVAVGNTLMSPSGIIAMLSVILIICGLIVLARMRALSKMNNK